MPPLLVTTWSGMWEVQAQSFGREENPDEKVQFSNLEVDYEWFELLSIEMADGRYYSEEFGHEVDKIIFNEAAIAAMGLENPVGKTVKIWGQNRQIIGVAKDFHFESLYEEISPCMIQQWDGFVKSLDKSASRKRKGNDRSDRTSLQRIHGWLTFRI